MNYRGNGRTQEELGQKGRGNDVNVMYSYVKFISKESSWTGNDCNQISGQVKTVGFQDLAV